jgi:hypothetical protein
MVLPRRVYSSAQFFSFKTAFRTSGLAQDRTGASRQTSSWQRAWTDAWLLLWDALRVSELFYSLLLKNCTFWHTQTLEVWKICTFRHKFWWSEVSKI